MNRKCVISLLTTIEGLDSDAVIHTDEYLNFPLLQEFKKEEILDAAGSLFDERYIKGLNASTINERGYLIEKLTWDGNELLREFREGKR